MNKIARLKQHSIRSVLPDGICVSIKRKHPAVRPILLVGIITLAACDSAKADSHLYGRVIKVGVASPHTGGAADGGHTDTAGCSTNADETARQAEFSARRSKSACWTMRLIPTRRKGR